MKLLLRMLGCVFALAASQEALAYRPFDSTDAEVADVNEREIELGPVQFRRSQDEHTLIAPAYVFNYGFVKNWELVFEGRGEHPLPPSEDTRSRFVGDALSLKGVLREGVLQSKSGPSVATEFGVLLPGINDERGFGASWLGIVSQRWSWATVHFNLGAELTRDHNADLSVGAIVEGPINWTIRPVAEVRYDHEFGGAETKSALIGAIWKVTDKLSFDAGAREAWVNDRSQTELRAGLTFAFSAK